MEGTAQNTSNHHTRYISNMLALHWMAETTLWLWTLDNMPRRLPNCLSFAQPYQVYKSELPDNIIRLFSCSNCCYDLRNSIKFEVPRFNLEVGRNLLRYRGALFWNSIPDNVKRAPSLKKIKTDTCSTINFNKMK